LAPRPLWSAPQGYAGVRAGGTHASALGARTPCAAHPHGLADGPHGEAAARSIGLLVSGAMDLVLATHNPGKLAELRVLLGPLGFVLHDAAGRGLESPAETGASYVENATIKAVAAARALGCLALSDDSGLEIDALGGAPGIDTAGFTTRAGGVSAARRAIVEAVGLATATGPLLARLHCALVLALPSGAVHVACGELRGRLCWPSTEAPGLAAIVLPDPPTAMIEGGVLAHRRAAFDRLLPQLVAARRG